MRGKSRAGMKKPRENVDFTVSHLHQHSLQMDHPVFHSEVTTAVQEAKKGKKYEGRTKN